MKYPQLVSMPSAVQDWLEEQLEARGIDAVVYTRYILSLLQRDTLDLSDDLLALSPSKVKEVGRRGRKRGRSREEYWDVLDCEQLKRSAAVECLMSACDQKCGIEKLVDELCAKLKEIQSEGESSIQLELTETTDSNKQSHTPSPQDQIQKYYAAFPPLINSKFAQPSSSFITLIPESSSVWSGKKVLANSFGKNKPSSKLFQDTNSDCGNLLAGTTGWAEENKENRGKNNPSWKEVGRENMKSRNQMKEKTKGKKETGYGFAWNMAGERNESYTVFCPGESFESNSSELLKVFHYNRQNQNKEDTASEASELQIYPSNDMENTVCRRLYERQTEPENNVYTGPFDNSNEEDLEAKLNAENEVPNSSSPNQGTDDRNLAQLIAKFDHSIEALWNPDETSSPDNVSPDDTTDYDQELPLDFQQLLSSPGEQYLTVELYNLNSKRNPTIFSGSNSFIQCGTNITSSIWSDQPSQENSIDQDDFGMDYMHCEQSNESSYFERAVDNLSETCSNEAEIMETKKTILTVGEGKVVGSKCQPEEQMKEDKSGGKEHSHSFHANEIVTPAQEKSNIAWNRYDNFPPFFTSLPWAVNKLGDSVQEIENKKWSNAESLGTQASYSPFGNTFSNSCGLQNLKKCTNTGFSDSLNTLNHNKEDSSFTEVIPKHNSCTGVLTDKLDSNKMEQNKVSGEHDCQSESGDCGDVKSNVLEDEKEEEDLLTSTKTHFRPIRMENIDLQHSTNMINNNVGYYADGTTFVIPTTLEEVAFRRSESGALYLEAEAEAGLEIPNKYMEYKEKESYVGRHRREECRQNAESNLREFVPKFRVRQNEKCCQTEETDDIMQSDEEVDSKRSRQEIKSVSDADEFYFPDDHFAEKIINSFENSCQNRTEIEHKRSFPACHLQKESLVSNKPAFMKYSSSSQNIISGDIVSEINISRELGTESLDRIMLKKSNFFRCKCNNNHQLQTWKTGWPKSQDRERNVWESGGSDKTRSWYSIWKTSPEQSSHICQCGISAAVDVPKLSSLPDKDPEGAEIDVKNSHYSRLREELTMEGEQLLSDLSYVQHLYQGSDWNEDTAVEEDSVSDWMPETDEVNDDNKLHCLSPVEDSTQEMLLYAEDNGCTRSLPAPPVNRHLAIKGRKALDDLDISCEINTFPKTGLLSRQSEAEWKQNERPFNAEAVQKDRKRRHSASQRACSYYLEGSCRRPHCRFSHDLANVPCRFWADSSCLKGIACPFLHGSTQALRPVTL